MRDKKKTVVLGASENPSRYSYLAINRLRAYDHPVIAVGKKNGQVADQSGHLEATKELCVTPLVAGGSADELGRHCVNNALAAVPLARTTDANQPRALRLRFDGAPGRFGLGSFSPGRGEPRPRCVYVLPLPGQLSGLGLGE
jgi:hypothetical protein